MLRHRLVAAKISALIYDAPSIVESMTMALIKCEECGGQLSTRAWVCPHCGARVRTNRAAAVIAGALVLLMGAVGFYLMATSSHP
jgi:hypothetical protein